MEGNFGIQRNTSLFLVEIVGQPITHSQLLRFLFPSVFVQTRQCPHVIVWRTVPIGESVFAPPREAHHRQEQNDTGRTKNARRTAHGSGAHGTRKRLSLVTGARHVLALLDSRRTTGASVD